MHFRCYEYYETNEDDFFMAMQSSISFVQKLMLSYAPAHKNAVVSPSISILFRSMSSDQPTDCHELCPLFHQILNSPNGVLA